MHPTRSGADCSCRQRRERRARSELEKLAKAQWKLELTWMPLALANGRRLKARHKGELEEVVGIPFFEANNNDGTEKQNKKRNTSG